MKFLILKLYIGGLLVLTLLVGCASGSTERPTPVPTHTPTPETYVPPERVLNLMVDGYMRLAIEYGIEMNREDIYWVLRDAFSTAQEGGEGLSTWDVGTAWLSSWLTSPQDAADMIRETAIDKGESPLEHVGDVAEKVKGYAEYRQAPLTTER